MTAPAFIPVLMYHQIGRTPPKGTPMRGLTVSPGSFARQMRFLKMLGYLGLSMGKLMPYLRGEKQGKVVGITFDDGYSNNIEFALPILQKTGFSATCYIVSDALEQRNFWDEGIGIPQKPLMSNDELCLWHNGGMEIGAHTRHHVHLNTLSAVAAEAEIRGCKEDLEAVITAPVEHFCYPYGEFEARHVAQVRAAGYLSATTTVNRRAETTDDLFLVPRIMVARTHHLLFLWSQLQFGYSHTAMPQ